MNVYFYNLINIKYYKFYKHYSKYINYKKKYFKFYKNYYINYNNIYFLFLKNLSNPNKYLLENDRGFILNIVNNPNDYCYCCDMDSDYEKSKILLKNVKNKND